MATGVKELSHYMTTMWSIGGSVRTRDTQVHSWSDWHLCRTWRARSPCFRHLTESFNWYNPVVVLSRSGANCVNFACNRRSRSSTVASRLGPGGGGVISFWGIGVVPSFVGLSAVVTGIAGKLLIIGDRWRRLWVAFETLRLTQLG